MLISKGGYTIEIMIENLWENNTENHSKRRK